MDLDFLAEIYHAFSGSDTTLLCTVTPTRDELDAHIVYVHSVLEMYPLKKPLLTLRSKTMLHYLHSLRVGTMFSDLMKGEHEILEHLQLHSLVAAGLLHDYGKIQIPDAILNKPGSHEPREREKMKSHNRLTYASVELAELERDFFPYLREIAILHHPYPRHSQRRKEERRELDIMVEPGQRNGRERRGSERREYNIFVERAGQLLALCDKYDALCSRRDYKEAFPASQVREELGKFFADETEKIEYLVERYPSPVGE